MGQPTSIRIGELLEQLQTERIVFAESCTGGMAAALMTQVSGISNYFCGSAVTYREATKIAWLDVSAETLASFTAESQPTTDAMAFSVLRETPEATIACAITGHLGPSASDDVDGVVFVSIVRRQTDRAEQIDAFKQRLNSVERIDRQREAAELMLERLGLALEACQR